MGVSFLQSNLQKASQAQLLQNGNVGNYNKKGEQFICLVQEPYVGKLCQALQPNSCKKYCVGKKPRVVIYTDKSRDISLVESLSAADMAIIHTQIEGQEMLVVSSYLDMNYVLEITKELENMITFATNKGWGIIIGMDSTLLLVNEEDKKNCP